MPTTILKLFEAFDIKEYKFVKWGAPISQPGQGVYLVSSTQNSNERIDLQSFNDSVIEEWINRVPGFTVDEKPATVTLVKTRLAEFWFQDECILYIGKAPFRKNRTGGIAKRVREYFNTTIGNGGPHSGGQWLKTLSYIDELTVYFAECDNPAEMEDKMLQFYMKNVSEESLSVIRDKELPIPFANIKFGRDKRHGFKNQRL